VDTPPELARRVAEGLVAQVLEQEASPSRPVRGLDPACGEGELLLQFGAQMRRKGLPFELFGIEIDEKRAEIARKRLTAHFPGTPLQLTTEDALAADWPGRTVVLANPPWVSFSGRESAQATAEHLLRHRALSASLGRWPSLHGAFLARIAAHVEAERLPARVLLPASVAEQEGYGPLRRETTARTRLRAAPERLEEGAFANVTVPGLLLTLDPRARSGPGSPEPWAAIGARETELLEPLRDRPRLPAGSFADPGVHTGNSAKALVKELTPGLPGLREGRDLTPYRLAAPRRSLDVHVRAQHGRRFRYGDRTRYEAVPVLLRQTAHRPLAALHTEPTYFRNSLLACTPPPGLAPELCVAVLNSTVAAAWHRLSFSEARQRAFPQVKVYHLRSIPFPFVERSSSPAAHDAIVEAVRSIPAAANEQSRQRQASVIDRLVFEAFGIEEPAREEMRAFSMQGSTASSRSRR